MESSWLLNKFSLSSPKELYREQYGDVHVAIRVNPNFKIADNVSKY